MEDGLAKSLSSDVRCNFAVAVDIKSWEKENTSFLHQIIDVFFFLLSFDFPELTGYLFTNYCGGVGGVCLLVSSCFF
jgi:hypothetical protein